MNTLTLTELPSANLAYREGNSDKVYNCQIETAGERFVVNFSYGRRGSTLNTGTKTNVPTDFPSALRIFSKLVKEKKSKGYTEGESGTPYQHSEQQPSGILPQLLNPIDEVESAHLMADEGWCMQEKYDGHRRIIKKRGKELIGINKKGNTVGLPLPLFEVVRDMAADAIIDGESIGDTFFAFDLLELDNVDIRGWSYRERLAALTNLFLVYDLQKGGLIKLAQTSFTSDQKIEMMQQLKKGRREGAVFKQIDAPYTSGRPNSGGTQRKHKFVATLSAVVTKVNVQRSVGISLLGANGWQTAGNVTIPANHDIPKVGQVVEVQYLYAHKESSVLFQPVYKGKRDDVDPCECSASQLKFKSESENNDEEN